METTGHPDRPDLETLVGLAVFRLGTDTRAARWVRDVLMSEPIAPGGLGTPTLHRLAEALGVPPSERADRIARARRRAARALASRPAGLITLSCLDPDYPVLLSRIPDPPIVLWLSGSLGALSDPAVAVVGSRRATPHGLQVARRLGRNLAEAGLVVVSGLARGIDAAAHQGALEAAGRTVAVLGNGPDVVYPPEHQMLARDISMAGAMVTEFPPATRPFASHFPLRNRIISGLSRAVVVVEASEKSGSLITARMALEQGRDVLAVPGSVVSGCYRGCHALIKDGARLVETVDDVLDEINWAPRQPARLSSDKSISDNGLECEMTVGEPVTADELAVRTGRPVAEWLAGLGLLELAGKVVRQGGGLFVRLDGPVTNRDR